MKKSLLSLPSLLLTSALIAGPVALIAFSGMAQAQQLRYMSCGDLWYERNVIYADKGYCFKTKRARRAFGRGCFPPYGRLNAREKRRVNKIQNWEYRKGCR